MILISAVIFPVSHAIALPCAAFQRKILILSYVTFFHELKIYNLQEALKKFYIQLKIPKH